MRPRRARRRNGAPASSTRTPPTEHKADETKTFYARPLPTLSPLAPRFLCNTMLGVPILSLLSALAGKLSGGTSSWAPYATTSASPATPTSSFPCDNDHLTCCASIEPAWFARKELEHVGAPFLDDWSTQVGIGCYPLRAADILDERVWYVPLLVHNVVGRIGWTYAELSVRSVPQTPCVVKTRLTVRSG